jgi:methyl-accepting chemotaxis protein
MKNWTIGRKLTAAFSLLVVLLLGASAVGTYGTSHTKSAQERTLRIADFLHGATEFETFVRAADTSGKVIMVAAMNGSAERRAEGHREAEAAFTEIAKRLARLKDAAAETGETQKYEAVVTAFEAWKGLHARVVDLSEKQDFEPALALDLGDGFAALQGVMGKSAVLQQGFTEDLADLDRISATATRISLIVSVAILLAAIGVAMAAGLLVRGTCSTLSKAAADLDANSTHVLAAANQVSASSQSLSQGASEQAASLEETSASMEEMASMTRQNAANSQLAAEEVAGSDRLMKAANGALQDLVSSMSAIHESSGKVKKIIKTIDEIAFQTNILALNAAVEAARAGEAGMGFAVVADEVRNLAQRSAQAAKDTASLIEESAANADAGGAKVDAVVASISSITDSSGRLRGLIDQVSAASRQQSQGIDQVTHAIAQMEKVTQTTAATAEESAAASEELNAQAELSLEAVGRLEALVGGVSRAHTARTNGRGVAHKASRAPKVVPLGKKPAAAPTPAPDAETQIPFGETGTYGTF